MMKERTLRVLEFTKIRDRLASKAMTDMGRERCEALEQSNAALRERIARSGDADRIAELARERLGLVLPDDRIYQ